ncbi:MAG: ABC transporter substrate-binding protein, partial [Bauldia sp.]|nr:ABC transporter substrate-binding protein [Bauldia sp.]
MLRKVLLGAAFVASATIATGAQAQITIAVAGPMTGDIAAFGQQMRDGAEQAIKDINAAGGVLGQQITLQIYDDSCVPAQAVTVANQIA